MDQDAIPIPGVRDTEIVAAWLYYHEGLTQAQVAKKLNVSRSTVAGLLSQAKSQKVVSIALAPEYLSRLSLAEKLKKRFSLTDVLVSPIGTGSGYHSLTQAGALYLENSVEPGETLGVVWGRTILDVALAMNYRTIPDLTVVPTLGGLSSNDSFSSSRVAMLIADKLHASVNHIYVPVIVKSPEVQSILMGDPDISSAFDIARNADRVILSVGRTGTDATVVRGGYITPPKMKQLEEKGAAGDLSGRFYDVDGRPIQDEVNDRILALTLEELLAVPCLIAVAGGRRKAHAILGALRGGYVDVLITDEDTAIALLDSDDSSPGDTATR